MTCPNHPPNTAITAANFGSMPQTQIETATIENANPEMPCTRPAMAAPAARSHSSDVMWTKFYRAGGGIASARADAYCLRRRMA